MDKLIGTTVRGIRMPIIKSGDGVKSIIRNNIEDMLALNNLSFDDNDIIAITESLIARAYNNYVTVDDIADFIKEKYGENATVCVLWPIYSRNRFSVILKGIARGAKKVIVQLRHGKDEVGNPVENPWTNVNIIDYYRHLVEGEKAECVMLQSDFVTDGLSMSGGNVIVSTIHTRNELRDEIYNTTIKWNVEYDYSNVITLQDIFNKESDKHGWCEYGLLGSNKCGDEKLKLFPTKESCKEVCEHIRRYVKDTYDKDIHVMVYGDGCFKDPAAGIWEFADPVSCPYYTGKLLGQSPNEIKIKYIADTLTDNLSDIKNLIKDKETEISNNPILAQGTTPRRYYDLIASLCDLTSGSGDKGTPVIWIKDYFKNYAHE
jgi:hypothetical protein